MPLPHSSQGTYSAALSRSAENPSSPYAAGARHLLRKLRRRRLRVVDLRAKAISYKRLTTQRPSAVFFDLKKCRLATLPFNCHICAHTSLSQHCYKTTYLARTNFRWSSKARWSMKRWRQWWHWIGASSFVPTFSRDPSPDLDRPWSRCELMDLCQTPPCARSLIEPHEATAACKSPLRNSPDAAPLSCPTRAPGLRRDLHVLTHCCAFTHADVRAKHCRRIRGTLSSHLASPQGWYAHVAL